MDIFNTQTQVNLAEQEARNLSERNRIGLDTLKMSLKQSFFTLWNNPNASPQDILNVFGTNAYKLFQTSRDTIALIKTLDPEWEAPVSPKEFTVNPDGSVTIIE